MEGVLSHANEKKRKKMLKNFKFDTFTGRFQVTQWQWKGQEEGIGAESECSNDDDVLCSRSRWGGGCCWPSCPCRTLWWTCGDLWRAVRSTPSCLWGPRTRTWRSRYRTVFNAVPHWLYLRMHKWRPPSWYLFRWKSLANFWVCHWWICLKNYQQCICQVLWTWSHSHHASLWKPWHPPADHHEHHQHISYHWHCTTWSEDSHRQTSVEKAITWQKPFEKLPSHF